MSLEPLEPESKEIIEESGIKRTIRLTVSFIDYEGPDETDNDSAISLEEDLLNEIGILAFDVVHSKIEFANANGDFIEAVKPPKVEGEA